VVQNEEQATAEILARAIWNQWCDEGVARGEARGGALAGVEGGEVSAGVERKEWQAQGGEVSARPSHLCMRSRRGGISSV
jgi:hypothetical protein